MILTGLMGIMTALVAKVEAVWKEEEDMLLIHHFLL
jgi:hypothetical protein